MRVRTMIEFYFLTLLQLPLLMVQGSTIRLNVPRVRLPYFDTLSVSFLLHVDTPGCYKWSMTRTDIVKLTTVDGRDFDSDGISCSDRAVISTTPRASFTFPSSAIVFAEEVNTLENVRCDVILDKIETIKIVTTNSYVHLEEAPSKFHVRAYGSNNNEFSTMEGVPMKWWLELPSADSPTAIDPNTIMRFLPFFESLYEAKPEIAALEAKRLQGSEVLVEGLKTGSVVVSARIDVPLYKDVMKSSVKIVVVANLLLEPANAYIVPESTILLKLIQVKQGRLYELPLPSDTYVFQIENKTVATYDVKTSSVTGLAYGETKITVRDKHNLDDKRDLAHALTAYIYVREPKFLAFTIRPYQTWALVIGQPYTVAVEVFDADSQKFHIGTSIVINTTFEPNFFRTEYSTVNGTYHIGKPIKTGTSKVTAELLHYVRKDGSFVPPKSPLKVHADMEIYQRVAINPKLTVLPWDPMVSPRHEIAFKPSGGSGNFIWSTTNTSVLSVNQNGHGKTEGYGLANVTASMTINTNIKGSARVYVLLPSKMNIVDHIIEAEIGAPILIPLAFYTILPDDETQTLVPFTTCRHLNFKVQIEDASFMYDSETFYPHAKPACAYLPIIGSQLGSTVVTVTYTTADRVFMDSVTVSTFKPLKVIEPARATTVLPVGSSRQLVFEGGPRPLLERAADFSRKMLIANITVAKVFEVTGHSKDDQYIYEVLCHEIGETLATIEIGNSREISDRIPVRRTGDVQVICSDPSRIYFKVETVMKADDSLSKCPHDLSSAQIVRIPVPNYSNILVSVIVKDRNGNRFDNISSLNIDWSTSMDIVTFQHHEFIPTDIVNVNGYSNPGKSYQTIRPIGKSGNIEITAEIVGYRDDVLRFYNIRPNLRLLKIDPAEEYLYQRSLAMDLQLVSNVSLEPASSSLFNHPSTKTSIQVIEGSGYFEVTSVPALVVETIYFEINKTIQVKPLQEGEVKIVVRDLCLSGGPSAETVIKVNGVGTIVLEVADKIQVSNSTILTVILFDKNGNILTSKDLSLINLKPVSVTTDLIELIPTSSTTNIQYKVVGKNVGEATVGFVADGPSRSRSSRSEIKRIFIFPPLAVRPKQLNLLVGSVYQAMAKGGPQPDSLTVFTTETKTKVAVTPSGIIHGKSLGNCKVIAKAIDQISSVLYSEDSLEVNVVSLLGIRIHTALNKIQVNETMPVWAVGLSSNGVELDPTAFWGGKHSLLSFEWSIGATEAAEMEFPFQKYGLELANDEPYFRLRAKKAGTVTIRLTANTTTGKVHSVESTVEVFEELRPLNVPVTYSPILMSPNSEISLRTNKDSSGVVTYMLQAVKGVEESTWSGESSIASIDAVGTLRSHDKIGDAVVRITVFDANSGITESIGYIILVRLVVYHMLSPSLPVNLIAKLQNLTSVPRGIDFPVTVSYHDAIGRRFHVTNVVPKIRPNRFDVVHFTRGNDNETFKAETTADGWVGVLIYNTKVPTSKDFLFFAVAEAIQSIPVLENVVNTEVPCASSGVKSTENKSGPGGMVDAGSFRETLYWFPMLAVPLFITIMTLVLINCLWKSQDNSVNEAASDCVFITRGSRSSPRSSTPRNGYRPLATDAHAMGDVTPVSGRRLFSTDSGFHPSYRQSTGSSSSLTQ